MTALATELRNPLVVAHQQEAQEDNAVRKQLLAEYDFARDTTGSTRAPRKRDQTGT